MLWIGVTGGLGSGKTAVAQRLKSLNFSVVDADEIAKQVLSPEQEVYKKVVHNFGPGILNQQGVVDRGLLAKVVFSDPVKLQQLEALLHPEIQQRVKKLRHRLAQTEKWSFYDVPLLFEKKMEEQFNAIIVVDAPLELRKKRIFERTVWSEAEFEQRRLAQIPLEEKTKKTKYVIQNDGTLSKLNQEIERVLSMISKDFS